MTERDRPLDIGPYSWMNWRAAIDESGAPTGTGYDALLFSDANIVGSRIDLGDQVYSIHNALGPHSVTLGPSVLLHVSHYGYPDATAPEPPPIGPATGSEHWIGLRLDEELSCLLSLLLGVRLRSAGQIAEYDRETPNGRPLYIEYREPHLPTVASNYRTMLPAWGGDYSGDLADASLLSTYAQIPAKDAVALVRAAKEFSTAVWLAESDPETAWLLLVTAIEVAASRWADGRTTNEEAFGAAFPKLATALTETGDQGLIDLASRQLAGLTRATQKFVDFIVRFLPGPPSRNPDWFPILDWTDREDFSRRARTIYGHRSRRLHGGIPFPAPLIRPGPLPTPMEVPPGLGYGSGYSTWEADDAPMTLHSFTHLVRGALLRWWSEELCG